MVTIRGIIKAYTLESRGSGIFETLMSFPKTHKKLETKMRKCPFHFKILICTVRVGPFSI